MAALEGEDGGDERFGVAFRNRSVGRQVAQDGEALRQQRQPGPGRAWRQLAAAEGGKRVGPRGLRRAICGQLAVIPQRRFEAVAQGAGAGPPVGRPGESRQRGDPQQEEDQQKGERAEEGDAHRPSSRGKASGKKVPPARG